MNILLLVARVNKREILARQLFFFCALRLLVVFVKLQFTILKKKLLFRNQKKQNIFLKKL